MKKNIFAVCLLIIFINNGCSHLQPLQTVTPALISTLQPTASFTMVSTTPALQVEDAVKKVQELFETNNDCTLPCFWGIVPGQTNRTDAKSVLDVFSSVDYGSHSNESSSSEYFFDVNGQNKVGVHITLYLNKDVVAFIQV